MTRSTDTDDTVSGFRWSDAWFPFLILGAGIIGVLVGGYIPDNAVLGLSLLACTYGLYGIAGVLFEFVLARAPRVGGLVLLVGAGVVVYALFSGYGLLMTE